jgi:hypothetical protein
MYRLDPQPFRLDFPATLNTALQTWRFFRPHRYAPCTSTPAITPTRMSWRCAGASTPYQEGQRAHPRKTSRNILQVSGNFATNSG